MEVKLKSPTPESIKYIADNMCESDSEELMLMFCKKPHDGILMSVENSDSNYTRVGYADGEPACIFGAAYFSDDMAICWLLCTPVVKKNFKRLRNETKIMFSEMLKKWSVLTNIVSAKNTGTIFWLKSLGAEFSPDPVIIDGQEVLRFYIRRKNG